MKRTQGEKELRRNEVSDSHDLDDMAIRMAIIRNKPVLSAVVK